MKRYNDSYLKALLFIMAPLLIGFGYGAEPSFSPEKGLQNVTTLDELQTVYQQVQNNRHYRRYLIISTMKFMKANNFKEAPVWLADMLKKDMRCNDAQLALDAIAAASNLNVNNIEDSLFCIYRDARMKYVGDMGVIRNAAAGVLAHINDTHSKDLLRSCIFSSYPDFEDALPALFALLSIQIDPDCRARLDEIITIVKTRLDACGKSDYCIQHYGDLLNRLERTKWNIDHSHN